MCTKFSYVNTDLSSLKSFMKSCLKYISYLLILSFISGMKELKLSSIHLDTPLYVIVQSNGKLKLRKLYFFKN